MDPKNITDTSENAFWMFYLCFLHILESKEFCCSGERGCLGESGPQNSMFLSVELVVVELDFRLPYNRIS